MSFAEVNGIKLHYQLLDGPRVLPTIVFLHGLVMDNLSSWFFTVAGSARKTARVLLYDLRGHGFSEQPSTGYRIKDHLCDLTSLLNTLAIDEPVILVGNSFGGMMALNFAQQYPDRVKGLVLIDAELNDDAWQRGMLNSLGLKGDARDAKIEENFRQWLGRNSARKSNRLAQHAEALIYRTSLLKDLELSTVGNDPGYWRKMTTPWQAIYGENSDVLSSGRRLKELLPQGRLHILEGCSHSVLWEKTELVSQLILSGIEELVGCQG